ncbi:MAG: FTR1 family iron permease [Spirochaetia bacterium]|nr:FTR1 family iron permease [Spirochaetia bacterium]
MYKKLSIFLIALYLFTSFAEPAFAAYKSWNEMVDAMEAVLNESYDIFLSGKLEAARDQVDVAYYGFYEKEGFEKIVMSRISGKRATKVEYQFSTVKKAILTKAPKEEVRAGLDLLIQLLREDANILDGKKENRWSVFFEALLIITREGFEAIIIVGAIVAYLIKSGNKDKTRAVYVGSLIALAASVLMAFVLGVLLRDSGQNQELIEGFTMLLAVAVLFYVSNWMVSKAESQVWANYIKDKVQSSITKGSVFSLSFAAFLAVFREGAETILFYQAVLAKTQTYFSMVWVGLGVGCVLLVAVYLVIRLLSIKLPLKPFFLGTSILLFIMSISFVGAGVKELQEGNLVSVTPLDGIASVELLGIYPTLETLVPQIVLLAITLVMMFIQIRRWGKARRETAAAG